MCAVQKVQQSESVYGSKMCNNEQSESTHGSKMFKNEQSESVHGSNSNAAFGSNQAINNQVTQQSSVQQSSINDSMCKKMFQCVQMGQTIKMSSTSTHLLCSNVHQSENALCAVFSNHRVCNTVQQDVFNVCNDQTCT